MSSSTTFSYAQAARGHTISPAVPQPAVASAPGSTSSMGKDDAASTVATSATAPSIHSNASDIVDSAKPAQSDSDLTMQKQDSEIASVGESASSAGPITEASASASRDGDAVDSPAINGERVGRTSYPASRAADDLNAKKGTRKGKKTKGSDSLKDGDQISAEDQEKEKEKEAHKVELTEAPIPTVNFWQQRAEARAKSVPVAFPKPGASSGPAISAGNGGKAEDLKKSAGVGSASETVAAGPSASASTVVGKPQRRSSESVRTVAELSRGAPRTGRIVEREDRPTNESLPPVQDASMWPTPESAAATEDGGKPLKGAEKTDRTDKETTDEPVSKPRSKKEWVPIPFVPSVAFQTPMPTRGGKPRGGGSTRGGREATSRGGHGAVPSTASVDKMSPTTVGGSSTSKSVPDTSRDRAGEGASPTRTPSQPPSMSKRPSTDVAYAREQRKAPTAVQTDRQPKETAPEHAASVTKGDVVAKGSRPDLVNGDRQYYGVGSRVGPTSKSPDYSKEMAFQHFKEQQGFRDRVEQPRGERGGRGGYRGSRGGHSGSGSQTSYPPNGQRIPPATHTFNPQQAAPFSPTSQQFAYGNAPNPRQGRAGRRPQSMSQAPPYSSRVQNGAGNPPRLASIHTAGLPHEYAVQPPYTAFPAPDAYLDSELIHGLMLQVEYYFSVDNLCKDLFLRKNMDTQGFVPLNFIASFKRMTELAPSLDFVRAACERSDKLDYIVDMEQKELIRAREAWSGFVLPVGERHEGARKPGPDMKTVVFRSLHSRPQQQAYDPAYAAPMMTPAYPSVSPTAFAPAYGAYGNGPAFPVYTNGIHAEPGVNGGDVNGYAYTGESQLSAAVPDFSPSGFTGAPTTLEDYQNFPDEQVEKIVVRSQAEKAAASSPKRLASSSADAAGPNGANGREEDASSHEASSQAGSLSPLADPSVLSAVSKEAAATNVTTPVDDTPKGLQAAAEEHNMYPELLSRGLDQRRGANPGETPTDMKELYRFWPDFLLDKFNVRMYEDFRACAMEDARRDPPSDFGLKRLLGFYQKVVQGPRKPWANGKPLPAAFNLHHAEAQQVYDSWAATMNGDLQI